MTFEQAATPMATLDHELVVESVNPALQEWFGARSRQWRGEALAALDGKPPLLTEAARRALAQQRRVWVREARLRTAAGNRSVDLALTPLEAGMLLLEMQPMVAEAGAHLAESLRGFAHEVRGPLTGMRGAAQLLERRVDAGELADLAGLIVSEVDRLAALSDRLLSVGIKPRLARINIHEVIERVIALLVAGSEPLRIRRDYDPSLPLLAGDADRLQQALLNLAHNAVEAGAGEVVLRTRAEQGLRIGNHAVRLAARIEVADDGCGVPAGLAATLFEPLVSGRAAGNGLGLAIAREIAREHGGELSHVSRAGATVFTLLLPITE